MTILSTCFAPVAKLSDRLEKMRNWQPKNERREIGRDCGLAAEVILMAAADEWKCFMQGGERAWRWRAEWWCWGRVRGVEGGKRGWRVEWWRRKAAGVERQRTAAREREMKRLIG